MFKFAVLFSLAACSLGALISTDLLPQLDEPIAGGLAITIPYVVSVQKNGCHSCGGSIYSSTLIVTAAQCLEDIQASDLKIRVGSSDRTTGGTLVGVSSFITHPDYDANTKDFDVAVIKLESALTFGANIARIDLVSTAPAAGTPATVFGWGTFSSGASTLPTTLQYGNVIIASRRICIKSTYPYGAQIKASLICVNVSSTDACYGDVGGPLVVAGSLVGIASWGYGCGLTKYPGVYTDVAPVRTWIMNNS